MTKALAVLVAALACRLAVAAPEEIRAVWEASGSGLYPGDWGRTVRVLRTAHVTDLFVNVAGPDFAHYASAVLPRSRTCRTRGDQLAACVAAARGTGLRVHAWVMCFSATRGNETQLAAFRRRGWCLRDARGAWTGYLDPSHPGVRAHLLAAVREIQSRYAVDGVHLDFVRWGDAAAKPADAAQATASFVAEARRAVKRPKRLSAAVYGRYPACVASVGQDWVRWLDLGLVDYVVPMDYTDSPSKFESFLRQHASLSTRARRTVAGIGVTSVGSRLTPAQVEGQVLLARRYGLAGSALFDLDRTLETAVLPRLKVGAWR